MAKRDVQGALLGRTLNPFNWSKFVGGTAGRSELAAEYYDEILFEGATFGDLLDKQTPVAVATGSSTGTRTRAPGLKLDCRATKRASRPDVSLHLLAPRA